MEFDPHTLHHLLEKIRQQMRCPQCGESIPVDFTSVRMTGDNYLLMQLRCGGCQAYIVLHASLQVPHVSKLTASVTSPKTDIDVGMNVSSTFCRSEDEVKELRNALQKSGGSFKEMFKGVEKKIL